MRQFSRNACCLTLVTIFILLSLLVAACGDLTPTAPQTTQIAQTTNSNTSPNSSGGTTSAAALTPGTQPATPATITPPVYSGLQKGTLQEMYPVLAGLAEAKSFRINDDWGGLSIYPGADEQLAHYSIVRQANGFEGQVIFSKGYFYSINERQDPYYKEIGKTINIPLDVAQKFLQTLAGAPVYEGRYSGSPIATHTDDYPNLAIFIDTGFGTLEVFSNSQQDNFYPWAFMFAGRLFTGTDATAFEAFKLLEPYLQKEVLLNLIKSARDNYTPNATPRLTPNPGLTPAPTNSGSILPSLLTPGFNVLSQPSHLGSINNVAVSPDGQIFATSGDDTDLTVRLWDKTGQFIRVLSGHTAGVRGLSFSPDGKMLASSGHEIKIWEVSSGKQLANFDLNGDYASRLTFSPDSKTLVSSDQGSGNLQIRFWDTVSFKFISALPGQSPLILPDGKTLVYSQNQLLQYYDLPTGKRIDALSGKTPNVAAFVLSPDGQILVSSEKLGRVVLRETLSGKEIRALSAQDSDADAAYNGIESLAFSPDGKYLVTSRRNEGALRIWQVADGKQISVVKNEDNKYDSIYVAFTADSQAIIGVGPFIGEWDLQGQPKFKIANNKSQINALALSPDGKTFVTGTQGNEVKLWDSANGKLITTFTGSQGAFFAVAYSPDGRFVAGTGGVSYYADTDNAIRLWDTTSKNTTPSMTLTGHFEPVQALAFSPDGKQLASGSYDRTIRLWDLSSGKQTAEFKGKVPEYFRFYTLAFSPDGKTLAGAGSGDPDNKDFPIKTWDIATGQEIASFQGHTGIILSLKFSPDGKTLASGSEDGSVWLWDVAGKKELARLDSKAGKGFVYSVAFGPEGKSLAVSYQNGLLALWDTATRQEISNTIVQSFSGVFYLAFSPDGGFLITGHQKDTALKRWQIK